MAWLPPDLARHYVRLYGTRAEARAGRRRIVEELGVHFGGQLYEREVAYLREYRMGAHRRRRPGPPHQARIAYRRARAGGAGSRVQSKKHGVNVTPAPALAGQAFAYALKPRATRQAR